jgi:hypothetical protein
MLPISASWSQHHLAGNGIRSSSVEQVYDMKLDCVFELGTSYGHMEEYLVANGPIFALLETPMYML